MGKYIVKRVLQFIPVFLGVTLILFALQNIVPGDPIKLIGGDKALSPEVELQLRVRYHLVQTDEDGNAILDENGDPVQTSLVDRYLYYMNGLLHGDLGNSYQRKLPVTEIFAQKYPYTVKLAACAIVLEAIMGIGAGIISAVKRYSFWDILVTLTTSILVAVPAFWLGMLLQLFFGVILKDATGRCNLHADLGCRRCQLSVSGLDALCASDHYAGFGVDRLCCSHYAFAAA